MLHWHCDGQLRENRADHKREVSSEQRQDDNDNDQEGGGCCADHGMPIRPTDSIGRVIIHGGKASEGLKHIRPDGRVLWKVEHRIPHRQVFLPGFSIRDWRFREEHLLVHHSINGDWQVFIHAGFENVSRSSGVERCPDKFQFLVHS